MVGGSTGHWRSATPRMRAAAAGRATGRWRLELRSVAVPAGEAAAEPALFVPYDHLRAGRAARIRTGGAEIGGYHEGSQEGRNLFAGARHVPVAAQRGGH